MEGKELAKPMVKNYITLSSSPQVQPYLSLVNNMHHCFVLTRFRLNLIHWLLAFPKGYTKLSALKPCPCDNFSDQDILHFTVFCELYFPLRKKSILPLLKSGQFVQVRPALLYLQMLSSPVVCFGVASFFYRGLKT